MWEISTSSYGNAGGTSSFGCLCCLLLANTGWCRIVVTPERWFSNFLFSEHFSDPKIIEGPGELLFIWFILLFTILEIKMETFFKIK